MPVRSHQSRRATLRLAGSTLVFALAGCLSPSALTKQQSTTEEISLEADTDTLVVVADDTTVETLELTLHNRTEQQLTLNPGSWHIEQKVRDSWKHVAAGGESADRRTVARGSAHSWSLSIVPHPTPHTNSTTYVTADLETGTYAFVVTGITATMSGLPNESSSI